MKCTCGYKYETLTQILLIVFIQVFALLLQPCLTESKPHRSTNPKLLLISFDGFRWNYLTRTHTPNFQHIIKNGVHARFGLTNAFITKTFPNHFTLATGLWEDSHSIVANHMYDPVLKQVLMPQNASALNDPAWFDMGAEPIWVTNQLQNGRSGVVMWIGGGAPIKNVRPSNYMPYNTSVSNETKIDAIIDWFKGKSDNPINIGLIYYRQPDAFGHWFGPESEQVTRMIGGLDDLVGFLLHRLEEENLLQDMNIIITSDHGFASTPKDKVIDLDKILDPNTYRLSEPSPVAAIWPKPGYYKEIYKNLTAAAAEIGHFKVYNKEDIPEHFHYTDNRRIAPIQVVADEFYSFTSHVFPFYNVGDHGYDNTLQDMHPFFIAMGPAFKKDVSVDTFETVDIYPLICHIMGLQPAPNNGSMAVVSHLLDDDAHDQNLMVVQHWTSYFTALICLLGLAFSLIVGMMIYFKRNVSFVKVSQLKNGKEYEPKEDTPFLSSKS